MCIVILFFAGPVRADVNVTQHHNHDNRDGLFIDSAFTQAAAVNLTRDTNFVGTIVGNVYAQPLYIEGGPSGKAMVIAVTESNNVYALNAVDGSIIWQRNLGTAVSSGLPCGNIYSSSASPERPSWILLRARFFLTQRLAAWAIRYSR